MGNSNTIEDLKAELRQRDIEIRELKGELALVNSIAHYRLTLIRARCGTQLAKMEMKSDQ
ncbi:hypothetical protein [Microbulbifer sp. ARAS458-1]|uniref:hypothetical protein n=1 Tax=Microbulbifer sp. ARAS458-1 TaxID=3140242 RepID=UPI003877D033